MNNRHSYGIHDLVHSFEASVGAPGLLVGVGGRQSDDVIGEGYLVR